VAPWCPLEEDDHTLLGQAAVATASINSSNSSVSSSRLMGVPLMVAVSRSGAAGRTVDAWPGARLRRHLLPRQRHLSREMDTAYVRDLPRDPARTVVRDDTAQFRAWQFRTVLGQQPTDGKPAAPIAAVAGYLQHGQAGSGKALGNLPEEDVAGTRGLWCRAFHR
jgi:hypothetical protein